MSAETDAHHVEYLALVPIGGAPDGGDGGELGFLLADEGFEAEMLAVIDTGEFINDQPARVLAVTVNAAEVEQEVEPERLPGSLAYLGDAFGVEDIQGDLTAELGLLPEQAGEAVLQFAGEFNRAHGLRWLRVVS
jgi:hypothetical protein